MQRLTDLEPRDYPVVFVNNKKCTLAGAFLSWFLLYFISVDCNGCS